MAIGFSAATRGGPSQISETSSTSRRGWGLRARVPTLSLETYRSSVPFGSFHGLSERVSGEPVPGVSTFADTLVAQASLCRAVVHSPLLRDFSDPCTPSKIWRRMVRCSRISANSSLVSGPAFCNTLLPNPDLANVAPLPRRWTPWLGPPRRPLRSRARCARPYSGLARPARWPENPQIQIRPPQN